MEVVGLSLSLTLFSISLSLVLGLGGDMVFCYGYGDVFPFVGVGGGGWTHVQHLKRGFDVELIRETVFAGLHSCFEGVRKEEGGRSRVRKMFA